MEMPVEIVTDRLLLKSIDGSFGDIITGYLIRNKDFFAPFMPWRDETFYTIGSQVEILNENYTLTKNGSALRLHLFVKDSPGKLIGDINFSNVIKGSFLSCHLGYKVDKEEINKGYMTEALISVIPFVFDKMKLHRVEANVLPQNKASIRLLEKLGFENEGRAKKYLKINGKWEDHLRFALLNENME